MSAKFKSWLINILKFAIAGGLIAWMVSSGKLDFTQLGLFFKNPTILLITLVGWFSAVILLASFRWYLLLKGMQLDVSYARVVHLHFIGLFFNSTMPGAVGGDIIKAVYVMRDHQSRKKTPSMLTILLDRVIGLMGLFLLGAVSICFSFDTLWQSPLLRPLVVVIILSFFATLFFYGMVFIKIEEEKDPVLKFVNLPVFGFSVLKKIYLALLVYRQRPSTLVYTLGISVFIQFLFMSYFMYLTRSLGETNIDPAAFATIYPIGLFTTALPLAPGGLGVGHVAFEKLYEFIGLNNGANVFNLYLLATIALNMTGVVPYLFFKQKNKMIAEEVAENA